MNFYQRIGRNSSHFFLSSLWHIQIPGKPPQATSDEGQVLSCSGQGAHRPFEIDCCITLDNLIYENHLVANEEEIVNHQSQFPLRYVDWFFPTITFKDVEYDDIYLILFLIRKFPG